MPHSHHSHSGQYIAHGVDPLESVLSRVLDLEFQTYCLTEHMPRIDTQLLYPEEIEAKQDVEFLANQFEHFLKHAVEIKKRVSEDDRCRTDILIGMEIEGCDTANILHAGKIFSDHDQIQFMVGSVHHMHGIPIDYDMATWRQALQVSGNNLSQFLQDYFNIQYEMLTTLKPTVVAHFDLFRLFLSASTDVFINRATGDVCSGSESTTSIADINDAILELFPQVEKCVIRNLKYIKSYGGVVEINTSGLRKNLKYPYPSKDIGLLVKQYCDSRFVLSDDAHGVVQVGTNYRKALDYIVKDLCLEKMHYLANGSNGVQIKEVSIKEFADDVFWKNLENKPLLN